LELRQITREIIHSVEEKSGIPVRVAQDNNLSTIAAVRMARKGASPVHLVLYKSYPGESPDYQISFECGYILRLFSNPPEKRFEITDTVQGQGKEEVEDFFANALGDEAVQLLLSVRKSSYRCFNRNGDKAPEGYQYNRLETDIQEIDA